MRRFLILLPVLCTAFVNPAAGQVRVSEEEVNLQKIFIDANRERILGNYENAESLYKEVLKQDKGNHAASYELGRIYEAMGEEDKAIKVVKNELYETDSGSLLPALTPRSDSGPREPGGR